MRTPKVHDTHLTFELLRPATRAEVTWLRHLIGRRTGARLGFAPDRIEVVVAEDVGGTLIRLMHASLRCLGLEAAHVPMSVDDFMREPIRRGPR